MSFKTSPILNRIKNIKGWKQSSFPTKSSNYSRDLTFGLKIYLLLKAYLVINNFKLLLCQFKLQDKSEKIIYILITHTNATRKSKKILLKHYFVNYPQPFYLPHNKSILPLLYNNLFKLKQFTGYNHYLIKKKIPSILWWKKTQLENW
jgi:hypothetical protein